jgi:hypothetical protein
MCIGVRRGPRAADGRQRKDTGQPDSSGRPRSRRVGLTYACHEPEALELDDLAHQGQFAPRSNRVRTRLRTGLGSQEQTSLQSYEATDLIPLQPDG